MHDIYHQVGILYPSFLHGRMTFEELAQLASAAVAPVGLKAKLTIAPFPLGACVMRIGDTCRIFVDSRLPPPKRIHAAAHEVGHLLAVPPDAWRARTGTWYLPRDTTSSDEERRATEFATMATRAWATDPDPEQAFRAA